MYKRKGYKGRRQSRTLRKMLIPPTVCPWCGRSAPEVSFFGPARDGLYRERNCKDCRRARYRQPKRDAIDALKLKRGCTDCGYRGHAAALEFDHLPGHVKRFNISEKMGRSIEELLIEIAKCEVVCANCHRIRTVDRGWDYGRQVALVEDESASDPPLSLF